jgi:DNA polymerase-3 subunit alpha
MYTHLHFHTDYSLLDGANKIKNVAKKVKELGMSSVAITDHGNMFGAIEFYQTMKREGIKPIIGIEAYVTNHDFGVREKGSFHLCLYAKDIVGYKNLMYLSSKAYENMYYKPRITKEMLKERSDGLIATSACLAGEVNFHLNPEKSELEIWGGYEKAVEVALEYKEIFGEDFYLEIMRHGIGVQQKIDDDILKISRETGIPIVATNDTHYTNEDDSEAHEVYMAIGTGKTWNDPKRMKHDFHEFYIKSPEEMENLFLDIPEAIENTNLIAEKCNLELNLGNPTPPNFKFTLETSEDFGVSLPETERFSFQNDAVLFSELSKRGLAERFPDGVPEEYVSRLDFEIEMINKLNFPGYMLIVWDFVRYSGENSIPIGPGRGSIAGSLVAFALKITDIDPMRYGLLFERFLNPERISMPDIDMDFAQNKRKEIIHYVQEKYGKENVAQVVTFNSLSAKSVIRDVSRVFEIPLQYVNEITKLIPDKPGTKLEDAKKDIQKKLEESQDFQKVWDISEKLEGLKRNTGIHAAGVVISNEELWHKSPLFFSKEGDRVTQYSLNYLEDVDLIKFDFLGLKTLDVIAGAIELIGEVDWHKIGVDVPEVYEMMSAGKTIGMFQIESGGMQDLNRRLKPSNFEDVIALIALYRPGPMDAGMLDDFVERKHGRKEISYPFPETNFPELEEILSPTYGVIVYQEQVMQIVQKIGGFSLGKSDVVRRAMGKKKFEEMEKYKGEFISGAVELGHEKEKARTLYDLIAKFAGYGFNKSHSAAYAMITFQTAYLKTFYPAQFMASLLSTESRNMEKIALYVEETKSMGIEVLSPDINLSQKGFSVQNGSIIFGLEGIKGVGESAVEHLLEARKVEEFSEIEDFLNKVKPSKGVMEALAKAGAFDNTRYNRKTILDGMEKIVDFSKDVGKIAKLSDGLFEKEEIGGKTDKLSLVPTEEFALREMLDFEKEVLNFYVFAHPLDEFREDLEELFGKEFSPISKISEKEDLNEKGVIFLGLLEIVEDKVSKAGNRYGRGKLTDFTGELETILFSSELGKLENLDLKKPVGIRAFVTFENENLKLEKRKILSFDEVQEEVEKEISKQKILEEYKEEIKKLKKVSKISEKSKFLHSQEILLVGLLEIGETKTSKAGNPYAMGKIGDSSGELPLIFFSSEIEALQKLDLQKPIGMRCKVLLNEGKQEFKFKKFFPLSEVAENSKRLSKGKKVEEIPKEVEIPKRVLLQISDFMSKEKLVEIRDLAEAENGEYKLVLVFEEMELDTGIYVLSDFANRVESATFF